MPLLFERKSGQIRRGLCQEVWNRDNTSEPFMRLTNNTSGSGFQARGLNAGGLRITDNTGSSEWTRIDANGNVGIGTTAPTAILTISGSNRDMHAYSYADADESKFDIDIHRARGTASAPTAVSSTTWLGTLSWRAHDGTAFRGRVAGINAVMDGTPGTTNLPTRLEFTTTQEGSDAPQARLIIKNTGNVGIGTTGPGSKFDVLDGSITVRGTNAALILENSSRVISPETSAALGGGVRVSTNVYIVGFASATKFFGDGSALTGIAGASPVGSALTSANIWVGNSSNLAAAVAMSGEGALSNAGAFTLSKAITPTWTGAHTFSANTNFPGSGIWNTSGNVGIGTTGPGARLDVRGSNTQAFNLAVGTSTAYSMVVSTTGNVGIGTTGPVGKLQVLGNAIVGSPVGTANLADRSLLIGARQSNPTWASLGFDVGSTFRSSLDFNGTTGDMSYWGFNGTSWSEKMMIKDSGNVGIGTAGPTHKLHVSGNAIVTSSMSVSGTGLSGTTPVFQVIGGTMTVLANGNVGIGITNPGVKLHVTDGSFLLGNRGDGLSDFRMAPGGGIETHLYSYGDGRFGIHKYGTGSPGGEVFSIANGGNVGIGTTGPGAKLDVAGNIRATQWIQGGCVNPADANDSMVPVGAWCVDKYETSVWSTATGGTQYGINGTDNYPCNDNAQNCAAGTTYIYARSIIGVKPSTSLTWFQANIACGNSGKELLPNAIWQMAAAGTPDPGAISQDTGPQCNTSGTQSMQTGQGTSCLSSFGAENMIGSVWEWVADWGTAGSGASGGAGAMVEVDGSGTDYNNDGMWNIGGNAYTNYNAPAGWRAGQVPAVGRGGFWGDGANAGVFAFDAYYGPSVWAGFVGFRCGRRR